MTTRNFPSNEALGSYLRFHESYGLYLAQELPTVPVS